MPPEKEYSEMGEKKKKKKNLSYFAKGSTFENHMASLELNKHLPMTYNFYFWVFIQEKCKHLSTCTRTP